jgi:hypothetical protein
MPNKPIRMLVLPVLLAAACGSVMASTTVDCNQTPSGLETDAWGGAQPGDIDTGSLSQLSFDVPGGDNQGNPGSLLEAGEGTSLNLSSCGNAPKLTPQCSGVPEPGGMSLVGLSLIGAAFLLSKRLKP